MSGLFCFNSSPAPLWLAQGFHCVSRPVVCGTQNTNCRLIVRRKADYIRRGEPFYLTSELQIPKSSRKVFLISLDHLRHDGYVIS